MFSIYENNQIFELPKLSGKLDINNRKEMWLNLIEADSNERYDEIAKMGDDTMKSAVNVIYDMREDTQVREFAHLCEFHSRIYSLAKSAERQ